MTDQAEVSQNFWVSTYEKLYGEKLRLLVAAPSKTLFPDKRELNDLRAELADALRQFPWSVKDGKIQNQAYDFRAIGAWCVALPPAAFPTITRRVAALYGIAEEIRSQRLAAD